MKRVLYILVGLLLVCASVAAVWHFTSNKRSQPITDNQTEQTEGNTSQEQNGSQEQQKSSENNQSQPETYQVKVYFSKHPDSDDDPSKTFPVTRTSPDIGVAKFAISELLKGPSLQEQSQNYFTNVKLRSEASNCNDADFTIKIIDSVANLQFCKTFDHIGSVSDGQAESNIRDTLLQFNSVQKVVILNKKGECEFDLSGLNLCKQ